MNGITALVIVVGMFVVLTALVALGLGSLSSSENVEGEPLIILTRSGTTAHLDIEVAETVGERQIGLMGRRELPQDAGMLFVLEERGRGFWMKDTLIPLSVAFIADCGEIVAFADMEPNTTDLHNTEQPYSFGLEVNQGWFQRNGVSLADIVVLPQRYRKENCETSSRENGAASPVAANRTTP